MKTVCLKIVLEYFCPLWQASKKNSNCIVLGAGDKIITSIFKIILAEYLHILSSPILIVTLTKSPLFLSSSLSFLSLSLSFLFLSSSLSFLFLSLSLSFLSLSLSLSFLFLSLSLSFMFLSSSLSSVSLFVSFFSPF